MRKYFSLSLVAGIVLVLVAAFSLFIVPQTDKAIILRLGELQVDENNQPRVLQPGLHFKVPFVDVVRKFDTRIQSLDIQSSRIPTAEKKELIVDLFTRWRIRDFSKFYVSTSGQQARAEQLLREKIVDGLRAEIGRRNLNDVVSQDRQTVMDRLKAEANNAAQSLGIEVVDARVVRIDLPQEVSEAVYNLMRTERQRVASEHRAKGQSRAETIRAQADAQVTVIGAEAEKAAKKLRGEGEAAAAKIYAGTYSKDPEFYRFYRSMEAYKQTFRDKNDILVIKPDNAFFKYFKNSDALNTKQPAAVAPPVPTPTALPLLSPN
ncbi:MAG TPA: protease modulator HflC [Gammaproteobacteria bacterium]|nr:protease modulator HflC [Gammaproteobacteria bacterium]